MAPPVVRAATRNRPPARERVTKVAPVYIDERSKQRLTASDRALLALTIGDALREHREKADLTIEHIEFFCKL